MRLALVALAFVLALPAAAQHGRPFAEKGDVALVAQVSGLDALRLNPALGGVGARYRLADQRVVAASVSLDAYDREQGGEFDATETGTAFDVTVWNENHFGRPNSRVSPFFGVGLGIGRGVYSREQVDTDTVCLPDGSCNGAVVVRRDAYRTTTYRGGVFVGAEVKLVSRLTLGAAYVLGVTYQDQTRESTLTPFGEPATVPSLQETRTFGVRTGITDLHLSVYF